MACREHLLHQEGVDVRSRSAHPSSTTITVVQVGGQPYGGQDDPAGGVAHEDDGLNALGPQDGVKRAAGERTGAVLGDDGLTSRATEGWISRAGSAGSTAPVACMGLRRLCWAGISG